jgi:hypothetical protein
MWIARLNAAYSQQQGTRARCTPCASYSRNSRASATRRLGRSVPERGAPGPRGIQAGHGVDQLPLGRAVRLNLGEHVGVDLQEKLVLVQRLGEQFPDPCRQSGEGSLAACRASSPSGESAWWRRHRLRGQARLGPMNPADPTRTPAGASQPAAVPRRTGYDRYCRGTRPVPQPVQDPPGAPRARACDAAGAAAVRARRAAARGEEMAGALEAMRRRHSSCSVPPV